MISKSVIGFCRFLRLNGFPVGIKETIDSLSAASIVTVADLSAFRAALRSLLSTSKEQSELFDLLFDKYWSLRSVPRAMPETDQTTIRASSQHGKFDRSFSDTRPETDLSEKATSGASAA